MITAIQIFQQPLMESVESQIKVGSFRCCSGRPKPMTFALACRSLRMAQPRVRPEPVLSLTCHLPCPSLDRRTS